MEQHVELLEVATGFETRNRYLVLNSAGQQFYRAEELNDPLTLQYGSLRPFDIVLYDNFEKEAVRLQRGFNCDSCCCPCCLQEMEVRLYVLYYFQRNF